MLAWHNVMQFSKDVLISVTYLLFVDGTLYVDKFEP